MTNKQRKREKWLRPTLIAIIVLGLLSYGVMRLFDLTLVKTSSGTIEFSPATVPEQSPLPNSIVKPRNIIFVIADGMGFSHLSLAELSQQNKGATSVWNEFEVKGWHDPRCSYGPLTDSGASATAMSTGTSTFFDVLGMDAGGNSLETLFELGSKNDYSTGIVTDSYIWDATPAAFVVHTRSRDSARDILTQMAESDLDILFGELEDVGEGEVPDYEETLEILSKKFQLLDESLTIPEQTANSKTPAAIYSEDEIQDMESSPNLKKLTEVALGHLAAKQQPFVLLVECEEMDSASHKNDSERVLKGLQSLQNTLQLIMEFAKTNGETLVVFTADHETGGLAVGTKSGEYPNFELIWATRDHTASFVPLLANGPGSEYFSEVHRNWEIGKLLKAMIVTK